MSPLPLDPCMSPGGGGGGGGTLIFLYMYT